MENTVNIAAQRTHHNQNYVRVVILLIIFCTISLNAQMIFESYTGPITQNEITAFKNHMQTVSAPNYDGGNIWVFGSAGKALEACGLMYEATRDQDILDRMIYYCDAALSDRNDIASSADGGQLETWAGTVDPVWPSSTGGTEPAQAGVEQGAVLSHIAYCAKLILETSSIWDNTVSTGDPYGFGTTYRERAETYIDECDYVIDNWILPHFIKTSENNRYYFPGSPNTYKPNEPAPWNQAWMLTDAFVRLTQCHLMLGDDDARVSLYDSIAQPNIDWFMDNLEDNTSPSGSDTYLWLYSLAQSNYEDANHFAYEVEGLWLAYSSGRYGLTVEELIPFANTYFDIIIATVTNGRFAGRVDGSTGSGNSGGDTYVRDEYIYLTEFRPEQYNFVVNTDSSRIDGSPQIAARLLWERQRRSEGITAVHENLALNRTASVNDIYHDNSSYNGAKAVDGSYSTRWATEDGLSYYWLQVDLDASITFNKTITSDYSNRVGDYKIQYRNGGSWIDAYSSNGIGSGKVDEFSSVTGDQVRLYIESTTRGPSIYEFEVYYDNEASLTAPEAPSGLSASVVSAGQIDLTWDDNSSDENYFRVERSDDNGTTWSSLDIAHQIYSDYDVEPAVSYKYRVKAENNYGSSSYSNTANAEIVLELGNNLALNKTASVSNVYNNNSSYNGSKAVDGSYSTRWATDTGLSYYWLEIDFGTSTTFNTTITTDYRETVTDYKIQYWNGSGWIDAYSGTGIAEEKVDRFASVTSTKVRLYIDTTWSGPSIYEFEVYNEQAVVSKEGHLDSEENESTLMPTEFELYQNYPNPFNPSTSISYYLPEAAEVNLKVYNILGKEVDTLVNEYQGEGSHQIMWNASSKHLASGIYIAKIETKNFTKAIKLLLLK